MTARLKVSCMLPIAVAVLSGITLDAIACTRAVYFGKASQTVTGRSMDWVEDIQTNLWVFPRGMNRDGGKKISGRERHIIVDTLGLLFVVLGTSANVDDGTRAPEVLKLLSKEHKSRLDEVRGDNKYKNRAPDRYVERSKAQYKIRVVERPAGAKGQVHLPYRWVVGRTNAWNGKYRCDSKDYERTTSSSEAMIKVSTIHLKINRLRPDLDAEVAKFT